MQHVVVGFQLKYLQLTSFRPHCSSWQPGQGYVALLFGNWFQDRPRSREGPQQRREGGPRLHRHRRRVRGRRGPGHCQRWRRRRGRVVNVFVKISSLQLLFAPISQRFYITTTVLLAVNIINLSFGWVVASLRRIFIYLLRLCKS